MDTINWLANHDQFISIVNLSIFCIIRCNSFKIDHGKLRIGIRQGENSEEIMKMRLEVNKRTSEQAKVGLADERIKALTPISRTIDYTSFRKFFKKMP